MSTGDPSSARVQHITSRENPLLIRLRKLVRDPVAYRKLGQIWLEGEHLCSACLARGRRPAQVVMSESAWADTVLRALIDTDMHVVVVPDEVFATVSALESPARMGFLLDAPTAASIQAKVNTVVLDRLQDAGNVGTILRSAAALGVVQVVAIKGTAALWSPKVLRAGMGAHFALHLLEGCEPQDLDVLDVPRLVTSSHEGQVLFEAKLPDPCAWFMGHEGQGVSAVLFAGADIRVRIPQPGGEESLNVAAAASICLYESMKQRISSY
jgi:TrmH family RNA methyltransferase